MCSCFLEGKPCTCKKSASVASPFAFDERTARLNILSQQIQLAEHCYRTTGLTKWRRHRDMLNYWYTMAVHARRAPSVA